MTFNKADKKRRLGTKNYHAIQYCRKCSDNEARRECIDCDPLEDGSYKKYCQICFEVKHSRGTRKRHQFYYITNDRAKPEGLVDGKPLIGDDDYED